MKKTAFLLALALMLALFASCGEAVINAPDADEAALDLDEIVGSVSGEGSVSYASYSDYCGSFGELEATAGQIVRAKAVSSVVTIGRKTTMALIETYKGEAPETFCLNQIANDNPAQEGNEYIVFMNPQTDDESGSEFYPVSGGMGLMQVDTASHKLFVQDNKLLGAELSDWLTKNLGAEADELNPEFRHFEVEP